MLRKIQQQFNKHDDAQRLVAIRSDLIDVCTRIAAEEHVTVAQVVNDLLLFAVNRRLSSDEQLFLWQQLTQREREVTALIWLGLTNPQIANRLSVSTNTIKTHNKNILAKFGVNSKEGLREKLSLLDLSEWLDMWVDETLTPPSADSPRGSTP